MQEYHNYSKGILRHFDNFENKLTLDLIHIKGARLKTEVKPKLKSAFRIDETEMTRIKDAMNDQIKKISGQDANFTYEVKYKNGVIAEHNSISDIVSEENYGSKTVRRISIQAVSQTDSDIKIVVNFSDISTDNDKDDYPISYEVYSNDKDWTFVTSSIVDERIDKVKSNQFLNFIFNGIRPHLLTVFMVLILTGTTLTSLAATSPEATIARISAIKANSKDFYEYAYQIDMLEARNKSDSNRPPYWMLLGMSVILLFATIGDGLKKMFPMYVFYWGDRVKSYDFHMAAIKLIAGGIILAFLVGLVTNYFYDWSGLGHNLG